MKWGTSTRFPLSEHVKRELQCVMMASTAGDIVLELVSTCQFCGDVSDALHTSLLEHLRQ